VPFPGSLASSETTAAAHATNARKASIRVPGPYDAIDQVRRGPVCRLTWSATIISVSDSALPWRSEFSVAGAGAY
jgi:hypothetical protein